MRRFLIFSWLLLACVLRAAAYDFSSTTEGQFPTELYYAINPDGATVTIVKGPEAYVSNRIIIPATVEHDGKTYTVTVIGAQAFYQTEVNAVEMPNTITDIQESAFHECDIHEIKWSTGLKHINRSAFEGTNLTEAILPDGVESIGNRAFNGSWRSTSRGKIRTVELPNSLTQLGDQAFAQQSNISSLKLSSGLKEIPRVAFSGCILTELVIPEGVEKIGEQAFSGITTLKTISFPASLHEIGASAFATTGFTEMTVPDNITTLGERAFATMPNLTKITFSAGLTELPSDICYSCTKLTEVVIPESVEKIGYSAFQGCTLLSHIDLPESVTELEGATFYDSGLTRFTFPTKLTTIGQVVFANCQNLTEITLPSTLTTIGNSTFSGCRSLLKVTLPDNLTTLPSYTFDDCESLREVNLPVGLTTIGDAAFRDCSSLSELTLPHTLTTIGQDALRYCTSLEKLTLPHSLESVGQYFLQYCSSLSEVHYQRAVLPRVTGLAVNSTVMEADNNCTLYVPTGSKQSYEESAFWNVVKAIVEEEPDPNTLYRISVKNTSGGSFQIEGKNAYESPADFVMNTPVTISFTPNNGYELSSLTLNGADVTNEVSENRYVIEALTENSDFVPTFSELPVVLSLKSGNGGSICLDVTRGKTFTCTLKAEEGWQLNSVYLNGRDVTSEVTADGRYTTPALSADAELSVAFDNISGVSDATTAPKIKAYVTGAGTLVVENLAKGEAFDVFSADGKQIAAVRAVGSRETIALPAPGVYIVRLGSTSVKVGF